MGRRGNSDILENKLTSYSMLIEIMKYRVTDGRRAKAANVSATRDETRRLMRDE